MVPEMKQEVGVHKYQNAAVKEAWPDVRQFVDSDVISCLWTTSVWEIYDAGRETLTLHDMLCRNMNSLSNRTKPPVM